MRLDLTWRRFGRLVAVSYAGTKKGIAYWLCRCDCGNTKIVSRSNLIRGNTQSCSCLQKESSKERLLKFAVKHGLYNTKLHNVWHNIKGRCYNKNTPSYHRYGGRGITICDEWKDNFKAFYDWAIENGYREGLTIDRIDNNSSYSPDNCRWISMYEQGRNRCTNTWIEFNGRKMILEDWSKELNIPVSTLKKRIRHHGVKEAFTVPLGEMRRRRWPDATAVVG